MQGVLPRTCEKKKFDRAGSVDLATAARRSLTGSINNPECGHHGHRGHDHRLHENIPSPDLNIARNPNPAEAPPCTTSPKSARQKCRSCHVEAPKLTRLLPLSNSRVPCQNCSPSLFTVGDLQCQRCFSSCPKKVAVTFGCTYLTEGKLRRHYYSPAPFGFGTGKSSPNGGNAC
jgi:hypothetical protein